MAKTDQAAKTDFDKLKLIISTVQNIVKLLKIRHFNNWRNQFRLAISFGYNIIYKIPTIRECIRSSNDLD
jgi:hypothetical protein